MLSRGSDVSQIAVQRIGHKSLSVLQKLHWPTMYSNFNATPFPALCGLDNRLLCTGNLLRAQELTLVHIEVVAVASEFSHGLHILASSISAAMICAQTAKERIWSGECTSRFGIRKWSDFYRI